MGASVERKRLVVKIGSSTLTTSDSSIDHAYLRDLSQQLAALKGDEIGRASCRERV